MMQNSLWKQSGVTLMEVMTVVVIIGILTAVVFPSYKSQISKTRRATATTCLTEYGQFMERVYTTNMTYMTNNKVDVVLPENSCKKDLEPYYQFSLVKQPTTFTLSASPVNSQAEDVCGILTLNQLGVRTAGGKSDAETIRACW